jgi:hypothetical protein
VINWPVILEAQAFQSVMWMNHHPVVAPKIQVFVNDSLCPKHSIIAYVKFSLDHRFTISWYQMRLQYKSVTFLLLNNFFLCHLHLLSWPLTTGLPFTQKGCTIIFCILFQGPHTNLTSASPRLGFYVKTTGNRSALSLRMNSASTAAHSSSKRYRYSASSTIYL